MGDKDKQWCKIYLRRDQSLSQRQDYSNPQVKVFAPHWVKSGIIELSKHLDRLHCFLYDNGSKRSAEKFLFKEEVQKKYLLSLQKIARNESFNVNGQLDSDLYGGVDYPVLLSIRDLVRQCVIAGVDFSSSCGGYRCQMEDQPRQRVYICDLAALQFQLEYNSGRLVLIKQDESQHQGILDEFIFENVVGEKKTSFKDIPHVSKSPSRRFVLVNAQGQDNNPCYIDTRAYRSFVREDVILYGLAICKIAKEFYPNDKIHFKFLKYGTGFFAGKFASILEEHILSAVLDGLEILLEQPGTCEIIKRIELPFYERDQSSSEKIREMKGKYKIDIIITSNDALKGSDQNGLVISTTNCGDNHAPCGNEMGYSSVDAAIAENLESKGNIFCPNINQSMGEEFIQMPEMQRVKTLPRSSVKGGRKRAPPTPASGQVVPSYRQIDEVEPQRTRTGPPARPTEPPQREFRESSQIQRARQNRERTAAGQPPQNTRQYMSNERGLNPPTVVHPSSSVATTNNNEYEKAAKILQESEFTKGQYDGLESIIKEKKGEHVYTGVANKHKKKDPCLIL